MHFEIDIMGGNGFEPRYLFSVGSGEGVTKKPKRALNLIHQGLFHTVTCNLEEIGERAMLRSAYATLIIRRDPIANFEEKTGEGVCRLSATKVIYEGRNKGTHGLGVSVSVGISGKS